MRGKKFELILPCFINCRLVAVGIVAAGRLAGQEGNTIVCPGSCTGSPFWIGISAYACIGGGFGSSGAGPVNDKT